MASGPFYGDLLKVLEAYYEAGIWKAMLVNGYSENLDAHLFRSDVVASEIAAGGGYTTGGQTISAPSVTFNGTTNVFTVAFGQVEWPTSTLTATGLIYYQENGADSADRVAFYNDFGGTIVSTSDDFTVLASSFELNFPD